MKTHSLRHILAIRSAWIAAAPFILSAMLGWFWLRPQMIADTEEHQRQLAAAIASRTEDYLVVSSQEITRTASVFSKKLISSHKFQEYLDTVLASSMNLTSLTFTDANGRITAIAFPKERASLRQEMIGIDLSLTNAVRQVRTSGKPAWSNTYLSPVGGGLAVAYATPAGEGVALGEISLAHLSSFLRSTVTEGKQSVFILDRRGQVIADQEGRYTARQYNLTNLEIVNQGISSGTLLTRSFTFDGKKVVGCLIQAPLLGWNILVVSPVDLAYRSALTTAGLFATALCIALLLASGLALLMSQSLARRFERLVSHAHRIESGEKAGEWPKAPIREFNLLGEALQSMANTLHKRESSLNEQLHFLQQLLDSIPIPVYYKDTDGLYLGCNAAFETFIGLPRRDIVGKTVYDVAPKERADKHHEADLALLCHPGVQTFEASGRYKDGEDHDVIFNKATFVDSNDCVVGFVGAMMDITSLRKAEEARKILETQLHQAQKMEAVGQLAGGIAHDFNNILTAIIGYAEIISMRIEKDSPLRHFIEQVLASADRAAELTEGLLAFSRKQVLHVKPIDLNGVVLDFKKMLGRLLPEDIDFRAIVAEEDLIVMADKGQVEQVLMNLVTNAKDAMPRGGSLIIEVSPTVKTERFVHAHGLGEPGNYACVSVADTGQGMDEEITKRIFEPFFTTKEVGKGTGLGMAMIYGIIHEHNGCVAVYSETGKGTTFKVYLPLITEEIKELHGTLTPEAPTGGTETILLAEDEVTVRELHKMILEGAGYTIVEAIDGADAFEKFKEHMADVDILVTDVVMPKIGGIVLYEEMRKIRPDIKVLFMSGYAKDIVVERCVLDDEFSYITKPVKSFELLRLVRDTLDRNRF
jgi:PAS domain S-box-containing protein